MQKILSVLLLFSSFYTLAQEYFPENTKTKENTVTTYAFINATIINGYDDVYNAGQLLIKEDKIVALGDNVSIPDDAVVVDVKGKYIYPSFVDAFSSFGMHKYEKPKSQGQPQYGPSRKSYYWNDHIRPEQDAKNKFTFKDKDAEILRSQGFGVVNTHTPDGIVRGTSMLVALQNQKKEIKTLLKQKVAQIFSLERSNQTRQSYPSSIMGKTALLRQFYYDAQWYSNTNPNNTDLSIEAFNNQKEIPQILYANGYLNALRADKIGDEFGEQYTIVGKGDEYKRLKEIKKTNAHYILPVTFPKAYDVENPYFTPYLSLTDMKHWHHAPFIFKLFEENQIPFSITANQLKDTKQFLSQVRLAVKKGLSKKMALEALTKQPAQILKVYDKVGNLNPGSYANFILTSSDIFDDNATIYQNWVMGQKFELNDLDLYDISGNYKIRNKQKEYSLKIKKGKKQYKVELTEDTIKLKTTFKYQKNWFYLTVQDPKDSSKQKVFTATIDNTKSDFYGKVFLENQESLPFIANYQTDILITKKEEKKKDTILEEMMPITYPNMSYGVLDTKDKNTPILFKNVHVITGEEEGTIENTDVLLKNGKINKIRKNINYPKANIIDGTGKYLTAGIVDEHSHIAATSVNESGHNSSAEVTQEDAINPDDISIYRALAGGVTSIQLLHGSANPIGGQSAILKLKWGKSADEMLYKNSPKFIKFALGENVKQSNWGSKSRFPQTRMGVEQVFIDYFNRAKAYGVIKESGKTYRKDLEMEALLEILNEERHISCHSYVQSEINMLMKVAEKFNFKINTFTHILEGYKLADKMKLHGAGGSTFSDWWAYKYEVNDAIPHNAAIMHKEGVTVAINSDDGEMIRRLNQEAAKTIKYGGVSVEDAWKFVTLNPAKLLHIDDRVGSIKKGKDADVVLWNAHPLSVYAKPEYTIIEGEIYFSLQKDKELRKQIKQQRQKLIALMRQEKLSGKSTQPIKKENKEFLHCDSEIELH